MNKNPHNPDRTDWRASPVWSFWSFLKPRRVAPKTKRRAGEWDSEDREARYDGEGGFKGTRR